MQYEIGKRVVDISGVLDIFEAQEGEVQHIIGKTGMGKTYEATRRALNYLQSGYTVYTTWRLNLPDHYDEREHFWPSLRNFIFGRNTFYRFDYKENWKYIDLHSFDDPQTGVFNTKKFSDFIAKITDAIVMLDEGQDIFDSHQKATATARQAITRTRHMHKTLIIISQRAQAVDVNARANVTWFYRCEKKTFLFWNIFRVYRTDEIDDSSNYPIWIRHDSTGRVVWKADLWHKAFQKKYIYAAYDSWYMRANMIRSQDLKVDAYTLSFVDRWKVLKRALFGRKKKAEVIPRPAQIPRKIDVQSMNESIWWKQKSRIHGAQPIGQHDESDTP